MRVEALPVAFCGWHGTGRLKARSPTAHCVMVRATLLGDKDVGATELAFGAISPVEASIMVKGEET